MTLNRMQPNHGVPGNSVYDGLRFAYRGGRVEISYPSRIHSAATACALAKVHGLEYRVVSDDCWTVCDLVPPGERADRLAPFFAEINCFPAAYRPFTSDDQNSRPNVSCVVVVTENLAFVESQLLPSLAVNSKGHAIEVILVMNGSCGEDAVTVPAKHLTSEWGRVAHAYNKGAAAAKGGSI